MFPVPVFADDDNETQVREFLVAPLLSHLGFCEADIETEFNILSRFGGTRKPLRADYVISVPNAFDLPPNRIVVEVKRPAIAITADEVMEQALIYGAHPSIQASHVVITNGRKLALFSISGTVVEPIAAFDVARLLEDWERIHALLGVDAIAREFAGVRVQRLIGAGGYGRVYEVVHPGLRRTEALKVLQVGAEQVERMRDRFTTGAMGLAGPAW
jgi:hypothetical protein